jgi:hypothetical protein
VGRRVSTLYKGEDGLRQQLVLYHVYYNFCLPHTRLRQPLPQPLPTFNLRGTAAFRRQGDRSGLTRAQHPSEAQSNKLCDPSMGEQNLLSKAASFRGQWFTLTFYKLREIERPEFAMEQAGGGAMIKGKLLGGGRYALRYGYSRYCRSARPGAPRVS